MRYILLAGKRLFRSVPFLLSLILLTLTVTASLYCDRAVSSPRAGVVSNGTGEHTDAMLARLTEFGFLPYESEQALRDALQNGKIDCGAVFPADIEQRITTPHLDGSILFLYSPTTPLPDLFRLELVTELLTVAAPYFSVPILEQLAPNADLGDEIAERYRYELLNGTGFVFDLETVSGKEPTAVGFGISLATAALSLFLFLLPLIQSCRLYDISYAAIEKRIGKRKALFTVFLPEALVSLMTTLLTVSLLIPLAASVSGQTSFIGLLLPALFTAILHASLGLVLPLLFRRADALQMLAVPVLLLTVALCPLFFDFAMIAPAIDTVRLFLPTYWLFAAMEAPTVFGMAALLALPLCSMLFIAVKGKIYKHSKIKETL